ncbi:MAG TPA: CRISPR-associated protein [Campylobacterales bacterium]|jgi:CRISPR/Cas system CSM-associated protein Csm3 (group 7 of RAMP superfamily)|nr:CRISPR-associated protein [Campylobacterales bacterium]HHH51831.1 CRISPR-associated protein [Campylobacterales bacterium]
MTIQYKIEFLDYWHLSSGLSAGAKLDSSVVKDSDGIPFVSGKTIKGLVREMAELLENDTFVKECFGDEGIDMGKCYFSNATLKENVKEQIVSNRLQDNLYDEIASTKIENGIAVDNSLREIEVVLPLTLFGEVDNVPSLYEKEIKKSLQMIKRMGLNRNRGLGRCRWEVV